MSASRLIVTCLCAAIFAVFAAHDAVAETPGRDGNVTVAGANTVVNQYAAVNGSAAAGATSITGVGLAAAMPGLAAGDLIMIYQAQGATIAQTDGAGYGAVTSYGNAGRYEFQTVGSVAGNTITFATYAGSCTGLRYSYNAVGHPQIVRVPQYRNLTVTGSIVPATWDGAIGGVVALTVSQTLSNSGTISASGRGFRGGLTEQLTDYTIVTYLSALGEAGAEKGESIAGYRAELPLAAFYGRGAPANGGGGGDAHNAGGGGGANGNNGNPWAGQGVPDTSTANYVTAWNLDPTLNSATNNSGGGRGGYSFGFANGQNPLVNGPGSAYGGDDRREVGGLGGRPLAYDRTGRIFFGGGGGAGDSNNNAGGAGGIGGGIVFIRAATISGSGIVSANGADGASTTPSHNDAPGGGGGGGTIIIQGGSAGGLQIVANGGAGGTQSITGDENEGPGGGGGGGVIAVASGGTRAAGGGVNGVTTSTTIAAFPPNGATRGATGQTTATAPALSETPICSAPPPTAAKSATPFATSGPDRFYIPGADVIYTITFTNPGSALDNGTVVVNDTLPAELDFYNGDIDGPGPQTGPFEFVDGATASGVTCCSGAQIAYSAQNTGSDFSYVPIAGYDPAVRRVRLTPTGAMNAGSFTPSSFQVRLRTRIK